MGTFIHIRSSKFPVLPGEKDELVNEGMYGKALAEYLRLRLSERGYDVTSICCEDWGWWVGLKATPFTFGVCIYSGRDEEGGPQEFACTDDAIGPKKWSWKKLRFIETSTWVKKLHGDLMAVFEADKDVKIVSVSDEFPDFDRPLTTD